MPVSPGRGRVTKNEIGPLVPAGVVTVRVWAREALFAGTTRFAVSDVLLDTITFCAVMGSPAPGAGVPVIVVLPLMKLVPAIVTATVVPRTPLAGVTDVTVGRGTDCAASGVGARIV
jgi:hypothetical protein